VGCGGYAAYFPLRACRKAGIPYVIQEQNRLPGLATRWLSKKDVVTFTAFAETASHLPRAQAVEAVGNPVDPRLATIDRAAARRAWELSAEARVILVTGGSSGARSINRNVARGLRDATVGEPTTLLWQTGAQGVDWDGRAAAGWTVRAFPFTDLMTEAFVAADLIVARAGALTLSEICAAGRAAILVPYPFATADHQAANARVLVDAGAALAIGDSALDDKSLLAEANLLLSDRARVAKMESAARMSATPKAADQIAARIIALRGN
jgi:UDP-N-acetylglucosamine--N-acetylmuramyl-(pentapeptide) pyrophosphoryl-undecaprenol N-acetylglucosamine transferase